MRLRLKLLLGFLIFATFSTTAISQEEIRFNQKQLDAYKVSEHVYNFW
jgi:hypothetical protein